MKTLHFFSAATINYIPILRLICLGIKKFHDPQYNIVYHILLGSDDVSEYQSVFKPLQTDYLKIQLLTITKYVKKINQPKNKMFIAYVRLFLPQIFPDLDRILYLDSDVLIVNRGIERLFEQNIDDYYALAAYDIPCEFGNSFTDRMNIKTKHYFNSGVMLFNLKKIREDGIDKQLEQDLLSWPPEIKNIQHDQTLMNYRFQDKVFFIKFLFNNMIFGAPVWFLPIYQYVFKMEGYNNILDTLKDSVIIHFTCEKPWEEGYPGIDKNLPLRQLGIQAFNIYKNMLQQ